MQTQAGNDAEQEKIARIRAEFPVIQRYRYFNAGTNGPLPQRTHDTLVANAQREATEGRISQAAFTNLLQNLSDMRMAAAKLLRCDASEITLTRNTTEGMNIALMGLNWRAGDVVVTATTEHPGGLHPVYLLHQRYGVTVRMTQIGLPEVDPVEELRAALSHGARAVVLSHVNWATGMVLPVRELADLAHQAGALFICDAAQAAGMVPSNVYDLGVDAYACSGQKWLCGPDGTGALFVRKERRSDIQQTFMGYFGVQPGMSDHDGNYVPASGGERYEASLGYPGGLKGLQTSLNWIGEEVGWEWVYQRIATLGRYCYDALSALDGVTLLTPREWMAGLVHFRVNGIAPADLTTKLDAAGFLIRDTHDPDANRVSTGFYNTEAEIDDLCRAIQDIRAAQ
ncbi:MAG TPA: aminotransferase class V-fold PLP-dependent enzyme [Ktedonobacterales bacterium]|jgi:L-cysteine/cystine lyase